MENLSLEGAPEGGASAADPTCLTEGEAATASPLRVFDLKDTKQAAKVPPFVNVEDMTVNPDTGKLAHEYRCRDCGGTYKRGAIYVNEVDPALPWQG
eukprot:549878-Alexandrium_andersonii.AAC.1